MRYNHNDFNPIEFLRNNIDFRKVTVTLAGIVVFVTTYALILPAIALEEQKATQESGIYLEAGIVDEEDAGWETIPSEDLSEEERQSESTVEDTFETAEMVEDTAEDAAENTADTAESEGNEETPGEESIIEETTEQIEEEKENSEIAEPIETGGQEPSGTEGTGTQEQSQEQLLEQNEELEVQTDEKTADTEELIKAEETTAETVETATEPEQPEQSDQPEQSTEPELPDETAESEEENVLALVPAAGKAAAKENNYDISVTFDDKAGLPADTKLSVQQIGEDSDSFAGYYEQIREYLGENATIEAVQLYDLSLMAGEEEIEPTGNVSVSMKYRMSDGIPEGADRLIVHFTKKGMEMAPYSYNGADVSISTTFDNLYNMAIGTASADRLFVNGQLKVDGNISKGAEMRYLIGPSGE